MPIARAAAVDETRRRRINFVRKITVSESELIADVLSLQPWKSK